jgi:hypothetical protein
MNHNCGDCSFLIVRERGGVDLEWFCRLLPGQKCFGVTDCSAWEPKPKETPEKKEKK